MKALAYPTVSILFQVRALPALNIKAVLLAGLIMLATGNSFAQNSYANTNRYIPNVQVSSPAIGGATDRNGACVFNAQYNNHFSESWIAVDPNDSEHLVAMSKAFFDPLFYLFHVTSHVSFDGGKTWRTEIVPGFDCQSAPTNSWTATTDPILAFDLSEGVYSNMGPFNFEYDTLGNQLFDLTPGSEISVVKSIDGGNIWRIANQNEPVVLYNSPGALITADKQWLATDAHPRSPYKGNVYAAWTKFDGNTAEIFFSRSTDHGSSFSAPIQVSSDTPDGPFNTYVFVSTAPDGIVYVTYANFQPANDPMAHLWLAKSTDGGRTFSPPTFVAAFHHASFGQLANTTFREGIVYSFTVNPANGHLLAVLEEDSGSGLDLKLIESRDGGDTWSLPISINDNATVADGTDQFQATVAAASNGTVAVAFYDRRLPCPYNDPNILQQDQGRTNFCIDTSIQFFHDGGRDLEPIGSNIRVTKASWDPQNPGKTTGQLPHPNGPIDNTTFIGDYFGLALTDHEALALFVSNYDLGSNPANDQQQVLGVVSIPIQSNR
ncbi:MAG TPA: sialidase family protein [Candidatus Angelobacter sp.]|nr:sialidase family protein [Candidatus Angelobacter sp.]